MHGSYTASCQAVLVEGFLGRDRSQRVRLDGSGPPGGGELN